MENSGSASTIKFACPKCHQLMKAYESQARTKVKCPNCKNVVTVPNPPAKSAPVATQPAAVGLPGGRSASAGPASGRTSARVSGGTSGKSAQKKASAAGLDRTRDDRDRKRGSSIRASKRDSAVRQSKTESAIRQSRRDGAVNARNSSRDPKRSSRSGRESAVRESGSRSARMMSQRGAAQNDKTKLYAVAGGGGVLLLVIIFAMIASGPNTSAQGTHGSGTSRRPGGAVRRQPESPFAKWMRSKRNVYIVKCTQFNDGTFRDFEGRIQKTGKTATASQKSHLFEVVRVIKGESSAGFTLDVTDNYSRDSMMPPEFSPASLRVGSVSVGQQYIAIKITEDAWCLFTHDPKLEANMNAYSR